MKTTLIVMSKAPRLGLVKTRLESHFSQAQCLQFHQACLADVTVTAQGFSGSKCLFYTGGAVSDFEAKVRETFQLQPQQGNDLGQRMYHAFRASLREYGVAIMIGTDCPTIDSTTLLTAVAELATHDVVLGPANDGGYYLIGLKQPYAELFEGIAWGTSSVLESTLQVVERLKLRYTLLPEAMDIDTWEDCLKARKMHLHGAVGEFLQGELFRAY